MNILIDILPQKVKIDGKDYKINSDFRISIIFETLMQDANIEDKEKIYMALQLYYPIIPGNIKEATEKMLWFYRCGKDTVKSKGKSEGSNNITQIYNFEYDDDYIYAAFMDQYNIDLQDINLHWWKFKAMFKSLKDDNEIVKIMGYRGTDISKIKDKDEKSYYKKMKKIYEIPCSKDEIDKMDKIEEVLLNGGDLSGLI